MSDNGTVGPMVIRRGDRYVVLNVELDGLTSPQRALVGVQVWDQVKTLMEINDEYSGYDSVDKRTAETVGCAEDTVNVVRTLLRRNPNLAVEVYNGTPLQEVQRMAGYKLMTRLSEGRRSGAKPDSVVFGGKGDLFDRAIEPLRRYLKGWKKRDFEFRHINPREAKRRLRIIDETAELLQEARKDILKRSHSATLRVPD